MTKSQDNRKFLLCLSILVDTLCWSIVLPVLPGLHDAVFHINNVTIGAISSLLSLLMFICGTLQGRASDYFGRITMLRISAIAQLLGHIFIPLSIRINSVMLYILARCIPSLFKCGMVVSQAYLYDISSAIDMSKDIGNLLAYSNIGFILGPLLGGYAQVYNVYLTFAIGCFLALTNMYILLQLEQQSASIRFGNHVVISSTTPSNSGHINGNIINDHQITSNQTTNEEIYHQQQQRNNSSTSTASIPSSTNASSINNNSTTSISSHNNLLSSTILDQSFLQYLHIKFAFQMGNSLFESLFTQHARTQLGLRGSSIGLLLSYSGLISAFTNRYLLRYVTTINSSSSSSSNADIQKMNNISNSNASSSSSSNSSDTVKTAPDMYSFFPEKLLWCYVLGASCGLYTWAVGSTVTRYEVLCVGRYYCALSSLL
jgi:MFS family permease